MKYIKIQSIPVIIYIYIYRMSYNLVVLENQKVTLFYVFILLSYKFCCGFFSGLIVFREFLNYFNNSIEFNKPIQMYLC